MFKKNQFYTRIEIAEEVGGGGLQDCLVHSGGRVIAICMRKDMNPDAPDILLVGTGPDKQRYSKFLCEFQLNDSIPIFTKTDSGWKSHGYFKVKNFSVDANLIKKHESQSGRNDVKMVIEFMEA
ncbi:MAG TPA: hypothetical protein VGJ94_19015 [Syntrophorhabdaceae bacterium]|jgi:hypothetical protein